MANEISYIILAAKTIYSSPTFNMKRITACYLIPFLLFVPFISFSQELYPIKLSDVLWHGQERELRYVPDNGDFVIVNGNRLFTRALYGTHSAFRVEAGDQPEFALYMPGMGGNFKLGIEANGQSKWLTEARTVVARYRPGKMIYAIEDPMLGSSKLTIEIIAMADAEGFVIKLTITNLQKNINLYWAFGGASGKKFSRDGDMGPDPESNFYLKPENCRDNQFVISNKSQFDLQYGNRMLTGTFDPASDLKIADAAYLNSPTALYQSNTENAPVIVGKLNVDTNASTYFAIHNPASKPAIAYAELQNVFQQAEGARLALANRIKINTPDPYINNIGAALGVAADAIWESPGFMHGAVGWRMRLNGWRGAYTGDALGWHDRAKEHFASYALSQVDSPAAGPVIADTAMHLSRSLEKIGVGMFTSGYISRDPAGKNIRAHHYDMNLIYIDELLRHFEWTGDLDFIKQTWPLLKRHLEWETRNFDADGNGLYDAYAVIWASDALQYSGGDVTHSSAYNYLAYKRAAQIAGILGEDATPYLKQAKKILTAMNTQLWMPQNGQYAEYKDRLGNQLLHPSAALWTIYHSIDSEVPDAFMAYQSLRYVDNEIPHIPLQARGLDDGKYYTLSTTNWMPYEWSLNNVALAESMHTALANWQAGRTDEAFKLFKSEILASMYLGGSPGNFVQISHYDAIRAEAYRDFADPIGMSSRALVEGLFGIVPDALSKTLTVRPGIPSTWNYASFSTPDISFDFKRLGATDSYSVIPKFAKQLNLKLQVIAQGQVKEVMLNGREVSWKNIPDAVGRPVIEIVAPFAKQYKISILWDGIPPVLPSSEKTYAAGTKITIDIPEAKVLAIYDPENALYGERYSTNVILGSVNKNIGNYTAFVQLKQGKLSWWMPLCFKVAKPIVLITEKNMENSNDAFRLQNTTTQNLDISISVNSFTKHTHIKAGKTTDLINVPESDLITGTNLVTINLPGGEMITETLVDWNAKTQGKIETVDISGFFNDKVTRIFQNKYLTPRPQTTTLQLPWQGIGDWPHPLAKFEVDDGGLRKLAAEKNSISLPQGIRFSTPGDTTKNNILFTSQWDNYPKQKSIPLSGKASHAWFLMAGSTNPMQSQMDNGELLIEYTDGTMASLRLKNPETWWPIEQDYYTDGFAFKLKIARPIRIHLKTGEIVSGEESKKLFNGKPIPGGAASVLDMPLDSTKTLKSITLRTVANDVVIGLMSLSLLTVK